MKYWDELSLKADWTFFHSLQSASAWGAYIKGCISYRPSQETIIFPYMSYCWVKWYDLPPSNIYSMWKAGEKEAKISRKARTGEYSHWREKPRNFLDCSGGESPRPQLWEYWSQEMLELIWICIDDLITVYWSVLIVPNLFSSLLFILVFWFCECFLQW